VENMRKELGGCEARAGMGRGMQDSSGVLVKGHMGNAALLGRGIENEVARAGLEGGGRKSSLVSRIPR